MNVQSAIAAGLVAGLIFGRAGSALFQSTAIIFLAALYDVQIPLPVSPAS